MSDIEILKRLYKDYTKKYLKKILASAILALILAGSTSSVAYLLDPAIKELFINKSETLIFIIPGLIIIAFFLKGISLYLAKYIMIGVAENVKRDLQNNMFASLIKADTQKFDEKHSGKFIGNLLNDVNMIVNLISTALLNLFKDSLTLIGLLSVMFYQIGTIYNSHYYDTICQYCRKNIRKRIGKYLLSKCKDMELYLPI